MNLLTQQIDITTADGSNLSIDFGASLLQLRGHEPPTAVPLLDTVSGDVLCFNGEIFGGLDSLSACQNDGMALLEALVASSGIICGL